MNSEYESICLGTEIPAWVFETMMLPNATPHNPSHGSGEHVLSRILKNNWTDLKVIHWLKLIDQKKILEIDFHEFMNILNQSNLSGPDIALIKDCRKKAQRAKSSLKCHTNKRTREIEQVQELQELMSIKGELMNEKLELLKDINTLKLKLESC